MTSHQKSRNGEHHPVFKYRNKWSLVSAIIVACIFAVWTTGFADFIDEVGVVRNEGIVESVQCVGSRSQQAYRVTPSSGPEFLIGMGRCENYEMSDLVGKSFYAYYHKDHPELPIEVKIGKDFGYSEGWNRSDIIAAIIISLFGGYLGFMFHCLYLKSVSEKISEKS